MCQCTPVNLSPPQFCRQGSCFSDYELRVRDRQPQGFAVSERSAYYTIQHNGQYLTAAEVVARLQRAEVRA